MYALRVIHAEYFHEEVKIFRKILWANLGSLNLTVVKKSFSLKVILT